MSVISRKLVCSHKARRDSKSQCDGKFTTRSRFTTRTIFSTAGSFGKAHTESAGFDLFDLSLFFKVPIWLGVQTPSLFRVMSWGLFRQF